MSLLKYLLAVLVLTIGVGSQAAPSQGTFGLNVGVGLPFLAQGGVNYRMSDRVGLSLGYNYISLSTGLAKATLAMPEVLLHFHPFSGSFFLAGGVGNESISSSATDTTSGNQVKVDITALTTIAKLGWMWGVKDGGFWLGLDLSYIMPTSPETKITAPGVPTTSQTYKDVVEVVDKYADTSYMNITFLHLGYLF